MTRQSILFACGDYDRVWAIRAGRVDVEGADINLRALLRSEQVGFSGFRRLAG